MTSPTAPQPQRDNLLGVCHALGETLGFDPLYLRLALLVALMWNAEYALIAYGIAALAVLAAKLGTRSISKKQARTRVYA